MQHYEIQKINFNKLRRIVENVGVTVETMAREDNERGFVVYDQYGNAHEVWQWDEDVEYFNREYYLFRFKSTDQRFYLCDDVDMFDIRLLDKENVMQEDTAVVEGHVIDLIWDLAL